jgi:competence protein ComEA
MVRKILFALAALIASMGLAFADVDVNKADQAALDGIKGIGPVMSKRIIDERTKGGAFKDWSDLEKRVKGIGDKNSDKMSAAGLTVNGQSKSGATTAPRASTAGGSKETKQTAKSGKSNDTTQPASKSSGR